MSRIICAFAFPSSSSPTPFAAWPSPDMAIAELRVSLRDSFMSLSASVALLVLGILFGATSDTGAPPWIWLVTVLTGANGVVRLFQIYRTLKIIRGHRAGAL
jgi:hypothetical protein